MIDVFLLKKLYLFPKKAWPEGVLADLRAGKGLPARALEFSKNVTKTKEIPTFVNIMMLWLLNGARPHHAAAATATLFSENLIKPMKY